jgi:antitoxin (DNA-binding transcriptional repressor) of toxin-antitoxin stability system
LKTVELADATASFSHYAEEARKETLVVMERGKPVLALMPLSSRTDLENLAVTTDPVFQAVMDRSQARYEAEGGISTQEMRRRLVARRKVQGKGRRRR